MRMVLGVIDEHDRECSARPIAICLFAPHLAELRDDPPVTGRRPAAGLAQHLTALNRHQHVVNREKLQAHARENPHIAPLEQRLLQDRQCLQLRGADREYAAERGRRQRTLIRGECGIRDRCLKGAAGLKALYREKLHHISSGYQGNQQRQACATHQHTQYSQPHSRAPQSRRVAAPLILPGLSRCQGLQRTRH